jgi:homoserine O-acetyltransferase
MHEFCIGDLPLASGKVLPNAVIAYETFGCLDSDGSNAILVTHGLTSGVDMLTPTTGSGEGSWADMLGPGRALDATRYFIVCSNVIGSPLGSTNPTSHRPGTSAHWGPDFPALTVGDMVEAQRALLAFLGVSRLKCVVGPSFGGMQALQWALDYPDAVDSIGVVVSGLNWPETYGTAELRERLEADDEWKKGWYSPGQDLMSTMTALRHDTLTDYGVKQLLERRWPASPDTVEQALRAASKAWASRFDANALLIVQGAGEHFDIRARLDEIRCPVLYVISQTDRLFPPSVEVQKQLAAALPDLIYMELDTPYGHSASGAELHQWEHALKALLARANESSNAITEKVSQ